MRRTRFKFAELFRVKHGYAFKSQFFEMEGIYALLTPGNFFEQGGFRLQGEKQKFYVGDVPDDYILKEGDLIVAMTEQAEGLLGSSAIVPTSNYYLHNQRLGLIVDLDESEIDRGYLYYLFNTREVRHQISASASGTKVRHTAPSRIGEVVVDLPTLTAQKRIGNILCAYDNLITVNARRMELLEQAARLLYEEWFVRLRFPGREHTRVIDGVPSGWRHATMNDVCDSIGGGTPSTKMPEYWDGDITWVVPTDVTRNDCLFLLDSERKITEAGLRESSATMLAPETILMTSRASVGFFTLVDQPVCTNQGFINIVPKTSELRMYMLFNLMNRVGEIRANAKGSTYPEISKGRFREMPIVLPPDQLLKTFADFAETTLLQVRCLKRQKEKAREARDLLIPRLMSGEIQL